MFEVNLEPHPGVEPGWMIDNTWKMTRGMVRAITRSDLEHLRRWRNDQQSVLRQQRGLTLEEQELWYDSVVLPSYRSQQFPNVLLVAVERDGALTSYGGLTNIDWVSRRGEVSFLAASELAADYETYADEISGFLEWLMHFTFEELSFHRLFTETWAFRAEHIALLEAAGMHPEGRLRQHVAKGGILHDALLHGILAPEWRDR